MAVVYWIHLPEHTSILTQGYVGFTSRTTELRFKQHCRDSLNLGNTTTLYRAMRKYRTNIIVTTLVEGSNDYCLNLELKLRGSSNTGWNINVGGAQGSLGKVLSDETKRKLSLALTGNVVSDSTRAKISLSNKGRTLKLSPEQIENRSAKYKAIKHTPNTLLKRQLFYKNNPWRSAKANKEIWSSCTILYDLFKEGFTKTLAAEYIGVSGKQLICIWSKFEADWNPKSDGVYLDWCRNYKEIINGT
jgi:hypothetical protein